MNSSLLKKFFLMEYALQENYGWKSINKSEIKKDCVICLDGLDENLPIYKLPCGDIFHYECIYADILTRNADYCPTCRKTYVNQKDKIGKEIVIREVNEEIGDYSECYFSDPESSGSPGPQGSKSSTTKVEIVSETESLEGYDWLDDIVPEYDYSNTNLIKRDDSGAGHSSQKGSVEQYLGPNGYSEYNWCNPSYIC